MRPKLTDFMQGAAFLLTYHLYILALLGIAVLNSYYQLNFTFRFLGQTVYLLPGFLLLLFATPIVFFLVRRYSKHTVKRILTIHLLIAVICPFFLEYEWVAGLFSSAPYIALTPIYFIWFHRRTSLFAWGALSMHIALVLLCYVIGLNMSHALSEWMIAQSGDDWGIFTLVFEFIARSEIGLIAPLIHLLICGIRYFFPSKKTA